MWLCHQYAWVKGRILAWRCNGGTQETWRYMHLQNSIWFSLIRNDFQQHAVNDMFFATTWNHERLEKSCQGRILSFAQVQKHLAGESCPPPPERRSCHFIGPGFLGGLFPHPPSQEHTYKLMYPKKLAQSEMTRIYGAFVEEWRFEAKQ